MKRIQRALLGFFWDESFAASQLSQHSTPAPYPPFGPAAPSWQGSLAPPMQYQQGYASQSAISSHGTGHPNYHTPIQGQGSGPPPSGMHYATQVQQTPNLYRDHAHEVHQPPNPYHAQQLQYPKNHPLQQGVAVPHQSTTQPAEHPPPHTNARQQEPSGHGGANLSTVANVVQQNSVVEANRRIEGGGKEIQGAVDVVFRTSDTEDGDDGETNTFAPGV